MFQKEVKVPDGFVNEENLRRMSNAAEDILKRKKGLKWVCVQFETAYNTHVKDFRELVSLSARFPEKKEWLIYAYGDGEKEAGELIADIIEKTSIRRQMEENPEVKKAGLPPIKFGYTPTTEIGKIARELQEVYIKDMAATLVLLEAEEEDREYKVMFRTDEEKERLGGYRREILKVISKKAKYGFDEKRARLTRQDEQFDLAKVLETEGKMTRDEYHQALIVRAGKLPEFKSKLP
jgi:hypothetical protein